jgi:small subunit ribosomal protein S3Ae
MAAKKSLKQIKVKKKKWYLIVTPKDMGETVIGETFLDEPELAMGRTVKVNLMQLTGDIKSQNIELRFEISEATESKLSTRIIGYYYAPSSIRRFVRRRMTRIDDSLVIMTEDGKKVRIKPFLLTRNKVTRIVEYTLRATQRKELFNFVRKTPYDALFLAIIKYQIQKEIREKLNKIYPIKSFEIRILEETKGLAKALESVNEVPLVQIEHDASEEDDEPKPKKQKKKEVSEEELIEEQVIEEQLQEQEEQQE